MSRTYRPVSLPECYQGGHFAELFDPDVPLVLKNTYLYAHHNGAWKFSCAAHAGLCHEACWPEARYPDVIRTRPRQAGSQEGKEG